MNENCLFGVSQARLPAQSLRQIKILIFKTAMYSCGWNFDFPWSWQKII